MSKFYVQENGQMVNKPNFINGIRNGIGTPIEVYGKKNGDWIRLDSEYVAKSYTVEGYCQWTASYFGESPLDNTLDLRNWDERQYALYNGYYDTRYWYGVISFKNLLAKVKGKNITKVEIRLRNQYALGEEIPALTLRGFTGSQSVMPTEKLLSKSFFNSSVYANVPFKREATGNISLNAQGIADIKAGKITGLVMWADEWSTSRYSYFEGGTSTPYRPYIKITYTESVWE